jgi:prophage maintenance system killer protein
VQPVLGRPLAQLLRPPPRAFLTRTQQLRLLGAHAAFRHLDSRVAMRRQGMVPTVVCETTPIALHALFEGVAPSGRETNPGMYRTTPTSWRPEANAFAHPDSEECAALVAEAISTANAADAPAFVRAAWLTFTMLCIHPFVDGNGRTSRALYLGLAAEDLELGIDWGIIEQWSVARAHYVEALQAGQQLECYDAARLDAAPFVEFSTEASIVGAELCRDRLELFEAELVGLQQLGLSTDAATVLVAVRAAIDASLGQLVRTDFPAGSTGLGLSGEALDAAIAELLERGAVRWVERPDSRRTMFDDATHALIAVGP